MGIVSFPGAKEQDQHVDTNTETAISVLHALTRRNFHLKHEGKWQVIHLDRGDVVAFKNHICHKGAACNWDHMSVAIHVPVNYENNDFVLPCAN